MRAILGFGLYVLVLHLSGIDPVCSQTSSIRIGETTNHPVIYNRTIEIPAATRPWYQSVYSIFTRSQRPVKNVTYTFPPNQTFNSSQCLITGVQVSDVDRFGKGGYAKIIDGGLHQGHVTINFISKPGEAMLFNVAINGFCSTIRPNASHANNTLHANPINDHGTAPSYGWNIQPTNASTFNSSLVQNTIPPSNSSWWHFW